MFEANDAALESDDGALKVQTGLEGQVKPVNVTAILPAAVIAEAEEKLTLTVVPMEAAISVDRVTSAPVITPIIELSVPVMVLSISVLVEDCVRIVISDLAS